MNIKMDKDCGRLSREHDSLLIKNEEIKELMILINDLTEENKQLSDELKEYEHRLNNNRSYNPDMEDEEELEL